MSLKISDFLVDHSFHDEEFRSGVVGRDTTNLLPDSVSVKSLSSVHQEAWTFGEKEHSGKSVMGSTSQTDQFLPDTHHY